MSARVMQRQGWWSSKPAESATKRCALKHMVVVDMDGKMVEGDFKPSSDVYSHLYIYKHRPDVGGVVHTHSRYATAFAAVGKAIPCVLTAMADEFGGPIPCGGFALIGDEAIGKVVVESIGKSPAVLLKNHGVFTIGKNADRSGQSGSDDRGCRRNGLDGAANWHAGCDPAGRCG